MNKEQIRERVKQGRLILDEIGPLLDSWDFMNNDFKGQMREEVPDLCTQLDRITHIVEFGRVPDSQADGGSEHG